MLEGLGMDPERTAAALSGGETRRVTLARVLVGEPDVLLLDEPTNHLDLAGIDWLEQELLRFGGALVLVSHDRAFLTRLSQRTWWLDRGRLHVLDDGFGGFGAWSEGILEAEEAELARLDKRIEAEMHWVHRGVTARRRRNMGRLRKVAELRAERRSRIAQVGGARLEAEKGPTSGRLVIEATGIGKAFADRPIVTDFSTRIMRGDRVGLVGPNGCGKTTLLGLLTGELEPDTGSVRLGTNLAIARFDQNRAQLDPDKTPWETLCPDGGDHVQVRGRWQHVVGYLRDFLFREDQARQPVKALSGGERNRLLLAKLLTRPANLLVLDEPTNDLDMETLELLEEMLAEWDGTLLLVSHDRTFLDNLVTSTIAWDGPGRFREYVGGYSDWLRQRPAQPEKAARPATRDARPAAPARAPALSSSRLQRELERVQGKLDEAGRSIAALEARLADPTFYGRDPAGFAATSADLEQRRAGLAELEERWLELELQREAAGTGA
ncbi:MAG: ATP-binding cassette domain-containing protein [Geminicoccaceae bacterium]